MEYTVQKLAKLAGVSARTLRFYDQSGLLRPARNRDNGYRVYGPAEVNRLQQILFYRELGFELGDIARILNSPGFDNTAALKRHREQLLLRRKQLDALIETVEQTINHNERGIPMNDNAKFEGFKQQLIRENDEKYGEEVRQKYGEEAAAASNKMFANLTQEQFDQMQAMGDEILRLLDEAFSTGDPASETAQKMAALHRDWLGFTWPQYSKEAHAGLGRMYAEDERFAAYYNRGVPGKAAFLRDAILEFLK